MTVPFSVCHSLIMLKKSCHCLRSDTNNSRKPKQATSSPPEGRHRSPKPLNLSTLKQFHNFTIYQFHNLSISQFDNLTISQFINLSTPHHPLSYEFPSFQYWFTNRINCSQSQGVMLCFPSRLWKPRGFRLICWPGAGNGPGKSGVTP
mgnify:CR=1 FL=1